MTFYTERGLVNLSSIALSVPDILTHFSAHYLHSYFADGQFVHGELAKFGAQAAFKRTSASGKMLVCDT